MDSARERHAATLFERVRGLPESERRAAVEAECSGDPDLRAAVSRLLADTEPTAEFASLPTMAHGISTASSPAPALLRAGQRFGDFRLLRLLGTGGFAQVWEVEDRDGRHVALKVLNQVSPSRQAIERFEREGRLAASLNHPHSVYIFGAFEIEGHPAIAMEYISAGSLEDRLREHGALPPKEAVDRILEVLEGLEAAHRLGIVHRDVKPSNCFLGADGAAKVGDFGISRSLELDTGLTATGTFLGTPAYASPEQIRGEDLDARSDLYSVGATLYALLTGKPPFEARNAGMLFSQILTAHPRPLSQFGVKVPRGLERAVLRLLEKDPNKRSRDCASARAALVPFSSQGLTFAGIAGRPGAFLLDSLVVSGLLSSFYAMAHRSYLDATRNPTLGYLAVDFLLYSAWFTAFETLWAGTPFKRLLGLRVTRVDGQRASFRSVLVRSVVFYAGFNSVGIVAAGSGIGVNARALLGLLGIAVVSLTMRSSNGFAGLHELASGTRVMRRRPADRRRPDPAVGMRPLEPPLASDKDRLKRGPYTVEELFVDYGNAQLLRGRDDALARPVWILDQPQRPTGHWDLNRPGRLRRLLRGESDGRPWEAFEAPDGVSLKRRVAARGRLPWEETSRLLSTLVQELRTGIETGDLPERISLDRLWVDASGQVRLLDFPILDLGSSEESEDVASSDWGLLLHQLLLFTLEGRLVPPAELDGQIPRLPLPDHARETAARLCGGFGERPSLAWIQNQLRDSATRPARVTRRQRGMALSISVLPTLLPALLVAYVMARDEIRVVEAHVAWKFVLGVLYGVGSTIAIGAVPAVVTTYVFRGGPWLRSYGIDVQTEDGRRASRRRCLLRGLVAYAPAFVVAVPWIVLTVATLRGGNMPTPRATTDGVFRPETRQLLYMCGWLWGVGTRWKITSMVPLIGAIYIAGAAQALARPERGLADLIARTHLVPR